MTHSLINAAGRGGIEEVRQLIAGGADVAAKNSLGFTALHIASMPPYDAGVGREGVVRLLLDAGAPPAATNSVGMTALHVAANHGHKGLVRILLDAGADLVAKDADGETALHVAAGQGHEAVITMLLAAGADLAAKATNGKTALDLAGHEGVARLLRDAGEAHAASAPAGVAEVPVGALSAAASNAGGSADADRRTDQTLDLAKKQKEKGNAEFKKLSYDTAADEYSEAIRLTQMLKPPFSEEQQAATRALKLTCLVHILALHHSG